VDGLVDSGRDWFRRLVGVKHHSTEVARRVVDQAIRVSGGSSYRSSAELSRLYRDVLAGMFHPSDPESVHATVASNLLGRLRAEGCAVTVVHAGLRRKDGQGERTHGPHERR
jgi:alkylation response protein AidB-like acyl-CoA dehydrogenase